MRQFYRPLFLSMEMGAAFSIVLRYSDHGKRCSKDYNADAREKKTQGALEKHNLKHAASNEVADLRRGT